MAGVTEIGEKGIRYLLPILAAFLGLVLGRVWSIGEHERSDAARIAAIEAQLAQPSRAAQRIERMDSKLDELDRRMDEVAEIVKGYHGIGVPR